MNRRVQPNAALRRAITEAAATGASFSSVAKRFGVTQQRVSGLAKKMGLPPRRRSGAIAETDQDHFDKVMEALAEGFSVAEAAQRVGIGLERAQGFFDAACAQLGDQAE